MWLEDPTLITTADAVAQAALINKREEDDMNKEERLQITQHGLKAMKGCHWALHSIRKLITIGEGTPEKVYMLLLDWEKAFDKISYVQLSGCMKG
eukprot:2656517-Karenia_brevis.AAC.1